MDDEDPRLQIQIWEYLLVEDQILDDLFDAL